MLVLKSFLSLANRFNDVTTFKKFYFQRVGLKRRWEGKPRPAKMQRALPWNVWFPVSPDIFNTYHTGLETLVQSNIFAKTFKDH